LKKEIIKGEYIHLTTSNRGIVVQKKKRKTKSKKK